MPVITAVGDDGVVTAWFVDEGSAVTEGQLIAEVQAEKVAEDVHAPATGTVRGLATINRAVPQGAPICTIDEGAEAPIPAEARSATPPAAVSAAVPRVIASPSAKRLARELGVDLASVTGTGPGGRVTGADVESAAGAAEPAVAGMTGLRAVIARNMRRSARETAPVTLTTTVDVTGRGGPHITAWIVRTAAMALAAHPMLNGTREDDRYTPAATAHIALAIQTDDGLVAPVVRNPAKATVEEVADAIERLAERARSKALTTEDFEGATFTVTNLGGFGIDAFTPIINLPQVAILGVGAIRTAPGLSDEGAVVVRKVMTLSLTFDHAFVDGAPAAEFLAHVRELLEGAD